MNLIFFQGGGGQDDYEADACLVSSLETNLGSDYMIRYPILHNEDSPDFGRGRQIANEISTAQQDLILAGHSLGASMLLKFLSENQVSKHIAGVFVISTPYWSGNEDWVEPLKLQPNFPEKLNRKIPFFFYHCQDDEVVPFAHFRVYRQHLPWASFREIVSGGHQLNNDLTPVARDIQSLTTD